MFNALTHGIRLKMADYAEFVSFRSHAEIGLNYTCSLFF